MPGGDDGGPWLVVIAASATHDMLCYEELALSCGWGGRHALCVTKGVLRCSRVRGELTVCVS